MKRKVVGCLLLLASLSCFVLGSAAGGNIIGNVSASPSAEAASALSSSFNYTVTLTTSMGTIVIGLFDDMPITTGNFENLTQLGYYDGTIFHRVVHNFVIQGGDIFDEKGITIPTIPDELPTKHSNIRGSVAMAKTIQPNSATSQFYINVANNTYLDTYNGGYSVFGQVTQGMDVVDNISNVTTDSDARPIQNVTVLTAQLQVVPEYAPYVLVVLFMFAAAFVVMVHKKTRRKESRRALIVSDTAF
jgi:cyclophilin family peptidyl-prolyl cis-trans isomerase